MNLKSYLDYTVSTECNKCGHASTGISKSWWDENRIRLSGPIQSDESHPTEGIDYKALQAILTRIETEMKNGSEFPIRQLRVKEEGQFGKVIAWNFTGDEDLDTTAAKRLLDSRLASIGLRTGLAGATFTTDDDGSTLVFWDIDVTN